MTSRAVNTTIPRDYHKRAVLNDISWTKAIMIGIDVLNDDDYNKEKKLITKLKEAKGMVRIYEKRLVELRELRKERDEASKEAKRLKENTCSSCGEPLTPETAKNMGDRIKLCRNCFMAGNIPKNNETNRKKS